MTTTSLKSYKTAITRALFFFAVRVRDSNNTAAAAAAAYSGDGNDIKF